MPRQPCALRGRDHRRFERYVLSARLEVVRKPPHATTPLPGLTMEISENGFSAMVSDKLEVGEKVIARIALTELGSVSLEAVVRNKNLFRYGFEFVGVTEDIRQKLKQACSAPPVYEGGWH